MSKEGLALRGISPFVSKIFRNYRVPVGATILDIPCGYGRHSKWLIELGFKITAADIEADRISSFTSLASVEASDPSCAGIELDANKPLPFANAAFDVALTIDFVSPPLLAGIAGYLKPGGLFIYQTMAARGHNWRGLPLPGQTLAILARDFEVMEYIARPAGPTKSEAETVAILARLKI